MDVLIVVALLAAGGLGTVVVLVRDPLRQIMVAGVYAIALVAVFVVLHAPDVALSAVVATVAVSPLLTLLALVRVRTERERRRGDGR